MRNKKDADESPCSPIDLTSLPLFKATWKTNYNKANILQGHNQRKTSFKEWMSLRLML